MHIKNPTWYLKNPCPQQGQGFPSFYMCLTCGYLTVNCEEVGDTFINPKNLELGFTEICPNCEKTKTEEFVLADINNILKAGNTKEDYK